MNTIIMLQIRLNNVLFCKLFHWKTIVLAKISIGCAILVVLGCTKIWSFCCEADKRVDSANGFKGLNACECVVTARDNEGGQKAR